ncbi:VPLPA-CTERM sorting domain-containing protein [Yoonia sp. R2331]|uniref:VPLPA-CTERM sorting domain-containing protein n=1 Tax=Yoonia sp. R2331 TaxID=3237238 RepID=UPI0034E4D64F
MKIFAAAAFAVMLATGAQAAVVASGVTQVGDTGGINAQGADVAIASNNTAYNNTPTSPVADWVWIGDINNNNNAVFEFAFDLTGYDLSTVSLSGVWGVDNSGTIDLNGTVIATLTFGFPAFQTVNNYGTMDSSLFNAGANLLTFTALDQGGPGAIRATAIVEATAVPLPAGAPLLIGGLALLGWMRKRKA